MLEKYVWFRRIPRPHVPVLRYLMRRTGQSFRRLQSFPLLQRFFKRGPLHDYLWLPVMTCRHPDEEENSIQIRDCIYHRIFSMLGRLQWERSAENRKNGSGPFFKFLLLCFRLQTVHYCCCKHYLIFLFAPLPITAFGPSSNLLSGSFGFAMSEPPPSVGLCWGGTSTSFVCFLQRTQKRFFTALSVLQKGFTTRRWCEQRAAPLSFE